jgi:transcription-repair coupling factor (superfamily II helicase)
MSLEGLLHPLAGAVEFQSIKNGVERGLRYQQVYGLSSSQTAFFAAGLIAEGPVLFIAQTAQSARQKADDLRNLLPDREILLYPEKDPVPFGAIARSREVMSQRLLVLEKVIRGELPVVVMSGEAAVSKLLPPGIFSTLFSTLKTGAVVDLEEFQNRLAHVQGYERVGMVEGPGQFSIRGGIIDIYPPTMEHPVRAELFDDEVDSLRMFKVEDQRSLGKFTEVAIGPAKELVITTDRVAQAVGAMRRELAAQCKRLDKTGQQEAMQRLGEKINEVTEKLEQGLFIEDIEQYFSFFYPDGVPVTEYFPDDTMIMLEEPLRLKESLEIRAAERTESHIQQLGQGMVLPAQNNSFTLPRQLAKNLERFQAVGFSLLPKLGGFWRPDNIVNVNAKSMSLFMGRTELLADEIRAWLKKGYAVTVLAGTPARAGKIVDLLRNEGIFPTFTEKTGDEVKPGNVIVTSGILEAGFDFPGLKLALVTDWEIFGRRKRGRPPRRKPEEGARITHFTDLKPGDYVVHVNHGIGRYLGIEKLEVGGVVRDYLFIQYAGEDKLYVPTDQIGLIQKYLGAEGIAPKLYRLGGQEWHRVKERVRESVREMAEGLLELYAAREKVTGHAYPPDTPWQKEFEDAFPYEETADQLKAIAEIKKDMESDRPMDRLLCGDVGYGKTEVAIRAAFKAVTDSKQVAVLVPTTILAQQHYNTFTERFAGYPVQIDVLSRFKSPREQRDIIKKVKNGQVDIVIGTHRLVQEDVMFKNMGLVIIDEEQRFGVAHKERLKQLRQNVDVLTLTATPIPRTLHMSMAGLRDMSILETPPEDRFPVQTYVVEFNYATVAEAVRRELDRGGQVFLVHNRVHDIEKAAYNLQAVVPEARVAVAHGQMREDRLERYMLDFLAGEYDILVCTTIIETGLDISNVNTLIVNDADRLGLAQLHQLRGRVGRSHRLAYAYFTYKKDRSLSEVAEKRLQAIREFTEFGSGFKIAMRDLEIRGAGNLLGPEQHGHMAAVGFDLYCRLLEQAVNELKGGVTEEQPDTVVDLNVDAHIGDEYITDPGLKIEVYKRIMLVRDPDDAADIFEEITDRYGDPPVPVQNLVAVARIKALAQQLQVQSITQHNDIVSIKFYPSNNLKGEQLARLAAAGGNRISFSVAPGLQINFKIRGFNQETLLKNMEKLLLKLLSEVK